MTKTCNKCSEERSLDDFYPKQGTCKGCYKSRVNAAYRLKTYGITVEQYTALMEAQAGLCAICEAPEHLEHFESLCVDHDHETGEVRGLLCNRCNRAIGLLQDRYDLVQTAADYLKNARIPLLTA